MAFKKTISVFCALGAVLLLACAALAAPVAVDKVHEAVPLAVYAAYLQDSGSALSIDEAAAPERQGLFQPLAGGLPEASSGALWLRFSLIKAIPSAGPQDSVPPVQDADDLVLNLGPEAPSADLYVQKRGKSGEAPQWERLEPKGRGLFALPDPGATPLTVFLHLSSTPSLWFSPVLEPAAMRGPGQALPLDWAPPALLAVAFFACLLRFLREQKQWRLWATVFCGCALTQVIFGVPGAEPARIDYASLPGLLAPGLTAMFLPHVGRHILDAGRIGRGLFLRFMLIPGALLALLPLVPGLSWTVRYLPFAPLVFLPLLPLAFQGIARSLPGAFGFLAASLMPVLGVCASLLDLTRHTDAFGPYGPLWGYGFGALALALARPLRDKEAEEEDFPLGLSEDGKLAVKIDPFEKDQPSLGLSSPGTLDLQSTKDFFPPERHNAGPAEGPAVSLQTPEPGLAAESLKTVAETEPGPGPVKSAAKSSPLDFLPALSLAVPVKEEPNLLVLEPEAEYAPEYMPEDKPAKALPAEENSSGEPPILMDAAPEVPVPFALPEHESLAGLAADLRSQHRGLKRELDGLLSGPAGGLAARSGLLNLNSILDSQSRTLEGLNHLALEQLPSSSGGQSVFTLFSLVRSAHDAVLPLAEQKNIGLSWFISPHLPARFEGDSERLEKALLLLLQDAVEAVDSGPVQLAVRRVQDKAPALAPGRGTKLNISVCDNGRAAPPLRRPLRGLARAWELAAACGGEFSVEYSVAGGMCLSFNITLTALDVDEQSPLRPAISLPHSPAALPPLAGFADAVAPEAALPLVYQLPRAAGLDAHAPSPAKEEPASAPESGELAPESEAAPKVLILRESGTFTEEVSPPEEEPLELQAAPAESAEGDDSPSNYVILADLAASRRKALKLILGQTPYTSVEARTAAEMAAWQEKLPAALVVLDADLPEVDVRSALERMRSAYGRKMPALLALCTHKEQAERMLGLGCDATLDKPVAPDELLEMIARLAPHSDWPATPAQTGQDGETSPAIEAEPEPADFQSLLARSAQNDPAASPAPAEHLEMSLDSFLGAPVWDGETGSEPEGSLGAPESTPAESQDAEKPSENIKESEEIKDVRLLGVSALDMVTPGNGSSLLDLIATDEEEAAPEEIRVPLPGLDGETIEDAVIRLIPGLIVALEQNIAEACEGRDSNQPLLVQEAASRLAAKAGAFGLPVLERMARCVERAAEAKDPEAIRDLIVELENMCKRYTKSLAVCHATYVGKYKEPKK